MQVTTVCRREHGKAYVYRSGYESCDGSGKRQSEKLTVEGDHPVVGPRLGMAR